MTSMVCCEICNRAGDECAETGTPIEWSEFGITVMPDCPERSREREDAINECLSDHFKNGSHNH